MKRAKEKEERKAKAQKVMRGAGIAWNVVMVIVSLMGIAILAVLIFIGVRLGEWLVPLFANA